MADQEPVKATGRLAFQERSEEQPVLYANVVNVNHTPWDFALHLYTLVVPVVFEPKQEPVDLIPKKLAVVSIPVTLVRGLIGALQTNLEQYERAYGTVEIPKQKEPGGQ